MDYQDRARIDGCARDIAPRIRMSILWPEMLEMRIFNHDDVNIPRWEDKLDEVDTVRDILDFVKTRGPHAFKNFLLCLRNTEHYEEADMLEGRIPSNPIENVRNNNIEPLDVEPTISDEPENSYSVTKLTNSQEPLVIKVIPAKKFMDHPGYGIGRYYMRKKPHGYVLIITIKEYNEQPVRKAAEHDVANLKKLFEDMGFEVTLPDPSVKLTGSEIKRIVREFSKKNFGVVDSCFVIISAHGGETEYRGAPETEIQGYDYGSPGYEPVLCSDIVEMFTAENCRLLIEKPKVFIFQACRGEGEQRSLKTVVEQQSARTAAAQRSARTAADGMVTAVTRNYSDILIAHSTLQGHKAYRDKYNGSWYIQILCEVFMNHACSMHIVDLFSKIDSYLKTLRTYDGKAQTSTVQLKGFRHLYLNPGIFEDCQIARASIRGDMEYRDRDKIDRCCKKISAKINMCILWPVLVEYRVFNPDDVNVPAWKDVLHQEETVREILDTIKTRGPYAFVNLVRSLRVTKHDHVADILEGKAPLDDIDSAPNNNLKASNNGSDTFHAGGEWINSTDFLNSHEPLEINVTPATKFMCDNNPHPLETYRMRSRPHGYVLIISVKEYIIESQRIAAEHDEANLTKLFQDMGFETFGPPPGTCLTGAEINRTVREFSQRQDFEKVDSCFVIIAAHGSISEANGCQETEIHGMDCDMPGYERVMCNDLVEMFTDENCNGLKDKPKVFIFQSCRNITPPKPSRHAEDAGRIAPRFSDTLIAYSTIPGHSAYRNESIGSWYITVLCEVFMRYACVKEIRDLFKMINGILKKVLTKDGKFQIPHEDFRGFDKNLYLNPKIFEDS